MILRIFWITHRDKHLFRNTCIFIWHGVPGYLTALQLYINFMKFIKLGMEIMFSLELEELFPVSHLACLSQN